MDVFIQTRCRQLALWQLIIWNSRKIDVKSFLFTRFPVSKLHTLYLRFFVPITKVSKASQYATPREGKNYKRKTLRNKVEQVKANEQQKALYMCFLSRKTTHLK